MMIDIDIEVKATCPPTLDMDEIQNIVQECLQVKIDHDDFEVDDMTILVF